ncbi:MAG: hypothetical protein F6K23_33060 [Okeania sp. SIO2C9]|uniref:hypothetical protein n=1 Tax=Okeania sp. SIO2C9 TaxID=2607791 RepID=UPI0013C11186|nr:hypothetical protein [Okeania sp. SIO2C9]NEQ77421.1 hypothetical protein [Okeania sp. SIO2C9]
MVFFIQKPFFVFLVLFVVLLFIIPVAQQFTFKSSKTEPTNSLPSYPIFQPNKNPKSEQTVIIVPEPDRELVSIWENSRLSTSKNIDVKIIEESNTHLILQATGYSSKQKSIHRKIDSKRNALEKIATYLAWHYQDESEAKQLFITGELINLDYQDNDQLVIIRFEINFDLQ